MIELLRRTAAVAPERPAVVDDDRVTTYDGLVASAEAFAGYLTANGVRRFGVLSYDAAEVVTILAGASLVGAEACVYPPMKDGETLAEYAARFDHDLVVTSHPIDAPVTRVELAGCCTAERLTDDEPPAQRPHLVLTTGTTGDPRGVRHDWARLLRHGGRVGAADERWLLAYGLHQFGGLQVLLHVFSAGATLVAPAPRRPREGLAAMRRHEVTHASATPTYWRFLLAEMRADGGPVPSLRQVTLGGEAVPADLLDRLTATFPDAHIAQIYAASEFGSSGSVRDNQSGLPLSVLDRPDDADIQMKIVDGELWVRSRVGMLGYYKEEPDDADGWRASGDLVEVVGDRVLFRGRKSDVINVGGVKVHPAVVEEKVTAVPGVAMARVFGRKSPVAGSIVAVEIVAEDGADQDAVEAAVREACAGLVAAARPRSIRFVDRIETTGDKVVRRTVDG